MTINKGFPWLNHAPSVLNLYSQKLQINGISNVVIDSIQIALSRGGPKSFALMALHDAFYADKLLITSAPAKVSRD
jgi:hypothetical protein